MAGFLDNKTQVIDMVLTDYGKELYSQGNLRFEYYSFSDDEVDYNPYISNSGSLSSAELTASKISQIENSLVREAVHGHEKGIDKLGFDRINIQNKLYSIPQGQKYTPAFKIDPQIASGTLEIKQRKLQEVITKKANNGATIEQIGPYDRGFEKFQGSTLQLNPDIEGFTDTNEGYIMRVFLSSSNGYNEILPKKDFKNDISYLHNMIVRLDNDTDIVNPVTKDKIARKKK